MRYHPKAAGFTLFEVLFAVVIIGILAAIAIPSYTEYIKQARLNDATQKAEQLQLLLQAYWEDNGTYIAGKNDTELQKALGWSAGDAKIKSRVSAGKSGIKTSFVITVTHDDVNDEKVVIRYTR